MDHPLPSEPQPSSRSSGLALKRVAAILVFVLGSGFLVYIGLTRTEVSRDYLRQEIESRFAETYTGRIAIEAITGNLQRTIRLHNVALYDEQEHLWLHIDEVFARPNWKGVLGWRFEPSTLRITRPTLHLRYNADSTWNLASVLTRRKTTSAAAEWESQSAHISVSGAAVTVSYQEHAPPVIQSGWLFDLAEATISDIALEGEINLESDRYLLAIDSLEASIDTLAIEANGELLLLEREQLHINALTLSSTINQTSVFGVLSLDAELADLYLPQSYFTPGFVQAIVPNVLLPDSLSLSVLAHRDGAQWSLQNFVAFSDRSRIVIPSSRVHADNNQVSFEASIDPSILDPADLYSVMDSTVWHGGVIQVEGSVDGRSAPNELEVAGAIDITTETGSRGQLQGTVRRDTLWTYDAGLTVTDLNPYDLTGKQTLNGIINGHLSIEGTGIQSPFASASLALSPSMVGERALDSLWLEGTLAGSQLNFSGFAFEQSSQISAEIAAEWGSENLVYDAQGELTTFDLGALLAIPELETGLNADWELRGTGTNLDDLSASIAIDTDSSTVIWETDSLSVPPTRWAITLHDTTTTDPRLTVQGDVLDLELSGEIAQNSLNRIAPAWTDAFSGTFDRFASHLRSELPGTSVDGGISDLLPEIPESEQEPQLPPIEMALRWELHAHPAVKALVPMLPSFSSNSRGNVDIVADGETFRLRSELQDDRFTLNNISAHQVEAALTLTADLRQEIESGWEIDLDLVADSLADQRATLKAPRISVKQGGRTGTVDIYTGSENTSTQGYVSSDIQLLPDRVQVQIRDVQISVGDAAWSISQPADIDLFADAAVLTPLRLETRNPFLEDVQTVTVQGNLSGLPADTLRLNLDGVDLNHLSNIFELRRPLGGQIDADLSWTGLWMPEITGTLEVDTLTFDNRLVGHLQASSILLPGGSDLRIAMIIDSVGTAPADLLFASNQMAVTGSFVVPGPESPGALDVLVDVQHLDASFLQLILREFADFRGGFNGTITLNGPLDNLSLGGSLDWENGHFGIPRFNSSYGATASLNLVEDVILVNQLIVQDPGGGTARLEGTLDLNDFQFLSFDALANLDSLQIMNVRTHTSDLAFYGDIRVSGDATLTGPVHTSFLRSDNLIVTPESEIFIPIREANTAHDPGFIVYVDPTQPLEGQLTSFRQRENILGERPEGERLFRDGLDMDLNLVGPPGSSIRLVIDPLLGDVINGTGTARVQIQRTGGDVATYGSFEISSGDYLFTAGEVFIRRFLIDSGTIIWNGEPLNPVLDIQGAYRTRASRSGLPEDVGGAIKTSLPVIVNLDVSGTLNAVQIDLALEVDQRQEAISDTPLLDSYLNRPDLAAEHATSVLLTNSFLLSAGGTRSGILAGSAVNSVSSLVVSQLNRYLSQVIPQADFRLGVQSDETVQDLDVSADIAFRLLDERLLIRGQGVYRGLSTEEIAPQGLEGEFIVQIQLSPSVAVEFFYRREGDILSESLINRETGLGLNYRTEFTSWRRLLRRQVSESQEGTGESSGS